MNLELMLLGHGFVLSLCRIPNIASNFFQAIDVQRWLWPNPYKTGYSHIPAIIVFSKYRDWKDYYIQSLSDLFTTIITV